MEPYILYCNDDELDMFNKTSYQTLHCSLKLTSPALSCAFQVKIYRFTTLQLSKKLPLKNWYITKISNAVQRL